MADTLQSVQWALTQTCRLRGEAARDDVVHAIQSVARSQTYASLLGKQGENFGIFGDVCVTSWSPNSAKLPGTQDYVPYPGSGFVISDEFKQAGGAAELVAMCARCPANTTDDHPAGCVGSLDYRPDSPDLQNQLQRIISRLGIEAAIRDAFLPTNPIWYGLWARSPLSSAAIPLIGAIVNALREEDSSNANDLTALVRATELAQEHRLPLHVRMPPPGHTDLGWYTIFPHCPTCKAEAKLPRWRRKYPPNHVCHVCGTGYSPPATESSTEDAWSREELRDLLGQQRFQRFAIEYLMQTAQLDENTAAAIVDATEAPYRARRDGA